MKRNFLSTFIMTLCIVGMAGCSSVTIRPEGGNRLSGEPTYQESKPYFIAGLIGESHIDAKNICGGSKVAQMQAQTTFVDGLLGSLTLGLYTPRTAKVWCE